MSACALSAGLSCPLKLNDLIARWANVSEGEDCVIENTPYIAYGLEGEFINIVSRCVPVHSLPMLLLTCYSGNCRGGLYCDGPTRKCLANKQLGEQCTADKECVNPFYPHASDPHTPLGASP